MELAKLSYLARKAIRMFPFANVYELCRDLIVWVEADELGLQSAFCLTAYCQTEDSQRQSKLWRHASHDKHLPE